MVIVSLSPASSQPLAWLWMHVLDPQGSLVKCELVAGPGDPKVNGAVQVFSRCVPVQGPSHPISTSHILCRVRKSFQGGVEGGMERHQTVLSSPSSPRASLVAQW